MLDFDSEEAWQRRNQITGLDCSSTPVVKTRRGYHVYLRHPGQHVGNQVNVMGIFDVRGDGGYVVGPSSQVTGSKYLLIQGDLTARNVRPLFRVDWIPKEGSVANPTLQSLAQPPRSRSHISFV